MASTGAEWSLLDADDRRELARGTAESWAEALRALERASGWDRRAGPRPVAPRPRVVGLVRSPPAQRWVCVGPP